MIQAAQPPTEQFPEDPAPQGEPSERNSHSPGPAPLPAHTPLPTAAILDRTLPAAALQALARLYAAAEPNAYRHTAPLDFDSQLIPLLLTSRAQVRRILTQLRLAKMIDWSTDGANRYTIHLLSLNSSKAQNRDSDVVADPPDFYPDDSQQQHTESQNGDSPEPLTVMGCLLRAGVWTDHALRIDSLITQNVRRGHSYLPDLRDVLGWIAFCYAYRDKHRVQTSAAVLSASLSANRRCPDHLRPPYICSVCCLDEAHCACEMPDIHLPPRFLDFAFNCEYDERSESFWGVCRRCHGYPCQCADPQEADQENEEDDFQPRGDTRGW